jgi:hypothetical protein
MKEQNTPASSAEDALRTGPEAPDQMQADEVAQAAGSFALCPPDSKETTPKLEQERRMRDFKTDAWRLDGNE